MLIIGIDYHPSFQQIASMDQETGEYDERRLNHSDGEAERFYRELKQREVSVRVGMEAADIPVGSSGYSQNWISRCGLAMPQRSADSACASRRPTARMPDYCCGCYGKIAFLESGYRVRKIATYGNCFGIDIGWCRCARGSCISYRPWRCPGAASA